MHAVLCQYNQESFLKSNNSNMVTELAKWVKYVSTYYQDITKGFVSHVKYLPLYSKHALSILVQLFVKKNEFVLILQRIKSYLFSICSTKIEYRCVMSVKWLRYDTRLLGVVLQKCHSM